MITYPKENNTSIFFFMINYLYAWICECNTQMNVNEFPRNNLINHEQKENL